MMGMRAAGVALVCVVATATDEFFQAPDWWKDTAYEAPLTKAQAPDENKFPGDTAAETDAAFTTGKQPPNMAAWEKDAEGNPKPCASTVLRDSKTGWAGSCTKLKDFPDIKSEDACRTTCEGQSLCAVWQHNPNTGCWMGDGFSCYRNREELDGESAQRLQHGAVTVLENTKEALGGIQVMGLQQAGQFLRPDGTKPSTEDGIGDCRMFCYSDIRCQYWQFSSDNGCWYDNGDNLGLDKDLERKEVREHGTDTWNENFKAGEYIQHYCPLPEEPPPPPATTPKPEEKPDLTWLWITLGVVGALLMAAVAYFLTRPKPKKREVKAKPAPPPPPPAPEPQVPLMQTVYMQTYAAPVQTYVAAPVQTYVAAPVQTYSAPISYAAPVQTYAAPMSYAAPVQHRY